MNKELANLIRALSIKEIVERRSIDTLCHFTRVENLSSILRLGLFGRSQLELSGIPFVRIDRDRIDGYPEAICSTVSFPNYKLFYKKREYFSERHGISQNKWVVLLLEARMLWELDCAFCSYNASANTVTSIPLEERKKPEALEAMFGDLKTVSRGRLNFPPQYSSSPQAEILVFNAVPTSYIGEIHFFDDYAFEDWVDSDYEVTNASIRVSNYYFNDRTTRRVQ